MTDKAEGLLQRLKGKQMSMAEQAQWDRYNDRLGMLKAEADELVAREKNDGHPQAS